MKIYDTGNFFIDITDGTLVLVKLTDQSHTKLREKAFRDTNILEGATYNIIDGLLHLSGDFKTVTELYGGDWSTDDLEVVDDAHFGKLYDSLHMGEDYSYVKDIRYGFLGLKKKPSVFIKRGYYLRKNPIKREYLTSNFRIISDLPK